MKFKTSQNNQRGMGLVETLLVVVIVAILAFAGWYVYDSNKKTNKIYDTTNQTATSQTTATKPKKVEKTFTFKEYSIKITLPDTLKDLSYKAKDIKNPDGTTSTDLFLNYPTLASAIDACNSTKGSDGNFAALNKATGQYPTDKSPIEVGSLLKQFDKFYVSVSYPNGNYCSDQTKESVVSAQSQALQKELVNAFKTAQLAQ